MTDDLPSVIRERRPADLDECAAILADVHRHNGYPVRWPADIRRWLNQRDVIRAWVAERPGQGVAGHIVLCRNPGDAARAWAERTGGDAERTASISRLFVAPGARGLRLGERLLTAASDHAWELGLQPVLGVLEQNRAAIGFYERAGWQRTDVIDFQLGEMVTPMHCFALPRTA